MTTSDYFVLIIGLLIFAVVGFSVVRGIDYSSKSAKRAKVSEPGIDLKVLKIMQYRIDQLQIRIIDIKSLPDGDNETKAKIYNRLQFLLDKAIDDYNKYVNE